MVLECQIGAVQTAIGKQDRTTRMVLGMFNGIVNCSTTEGDVGVFSHHLFKTKSMTSVISISSLYYSYTKNKDFLSDISFEIPEKDIFFIIGANGAGKSTLLKNILGLLTPDAGKIVIAGVEMNPANRLSIMPKVGVLIENAAFYGHLTVKQNAYLIAEYYNVPKVYADEAIKTVGLEQEKNKKAAQLSTGFKQRLGLATAILHQPTLVILDEPTNGLDPQGIIEFRDLVIQLNRERGITFLMTTHILNEVERLATRVAIIREGQILETFSLQHLYQTYELLELHPPAEQNLLKYPNALHYKSGDAVHIILPKTVNLEDSNFQTHGEPSFSVKPINLETYYLGKCYEHDTRSKN